MDELAHVSIIDNSRIPLVLDRGSTAGKKWVKIDLEMQHQCHSYWCWAAVAASISAFYNKRAGFTQCLIANLELHRDDCCGAPCGIDDVDYNQSHTLPLNRVDCLKAWVRDERATREEVLKELKAGRPICVRTVWLKGKKRENVLADGTAAGAHFVSLIGYHSDCDMLAIEDPWWGCIKIGYDQFCTHYTDAKGEWEDTYYTKSSIARSADRKNAHRS